MARLFGGPSVPWLPSPWRFRHSRHSPAYRAMLVPLLDPLTGRISTNSPPAQSVVQCCRMGSGLVSADTGDGTEAEPGAMPGPRLQEDIHAV